MVKPSRWQFFGASVKGLGHVQLGLPNQDAWTGRHYSFGSFIAVCDGVGSRPHAAHGARQACLAAADAVRLWSKADQAPVAMLVRLVHTLWSICVHACGQWQCATTCLMAAGLGNDRLLIGQLGDGLAMVKLTNGDLRILTHPEESEFTNETAALGTGTSPGEWRIGLIDNVAIGTSVLLATDGVSDDLLPGKLGAFADFVRTEFAPRAPRNRWCELVQALRNWPTPRHNDDKTLAFMWRTR